MRRTECLNRRTKECRVVMRLHLFLFILKMNWHNEKITEKNNSFIFIYDVRCAFQIKVKSYLIWGRHQIIVRMKFLCASLAVLMMMMMMRCDAMREINSDRSSEIFFETITYKQQTNRIRLTLRLFHKTL